MTLGKAYQTFCTEIASVNLFARLSAGKQIDTNNQLDGWPVDQVLYMKYCIIIHAITMHFNLRKHENDALEYWMGLTVSGKEDAWRWFWVDGTEANYTSWHTTTDEPNYIATSR